MIGAFMRRRFAKIREINRRYAKPKVRMTRGVSIALFLLRAYLILLVILLFVRFFTLIKK
jgi:hypothetical protein